MIGLGSDKNSAAKLSGFPFYSTNTIMGGFLHYYIGEGGLGSPVESSNLTNVILKVFGPFLPWQLF